jgi:ParB family chromosome partitioning protein
VEDGAKALPERLVADLSAHRTAALRDRLAQEPQAALLVALHSLVLQLFDFYGAEACVDLRATTTELSRFAEGYDDSVAGLSIASRHEGWAGQLPEQAQDLWAALVSLSEAERLALFAHCVSLTVNAVQAVGRSPRALADADGLARYLGLDMRAYWQATAENYFGRVSKAMILDAVREAKSPEDALRLDGLKKDAMAKAAADLLGSEGWLPPLLQDAAAPPA